MHLRVNARREVKAIPLARETSALGILAWLRLLDICIRQRAMTCKVFHNNIKVQGADPIQLWHADYLRVEAITTGRHVQTPLLTATSDQQCTREHREGEAFWPRPPTVRSRTEIQTLTRTTATTRTVQRSLHEAYWFAATIFIWMVVPLLIAIHEQETPYTEMQKKMSRQWRIT